MNPISGAVDVPSPLSPTTKPSLPICPFFIIYVGGNVVQANRIRWGPGRKFQFMVSASMPVFDQRNMTVSLEKPSSSTQKQQQPNAQTKEKQVLQLLSFMLCFLLPCYFMRNIIKFSRGTLNRKKIQFNKKLMLSQVTPFMSFAAVSCMCVFYKHNGLQVTSLNLYLI